MVALRRKTIATPAPAGAAPAPVYPNPQQRALVQRLTAIERIVRNFKALIAQNQDLLRDESIMHQIALLEEWLDSYKRGLLAADKIRTQGAQWLASHRSRLQPMNGKSLLTPGATPIPTATRILKQAEKELEQPVSSQPVSGTEPTVAAADTALPAPTPR